MPPPGPEFTAALAKVVMAAKDKAVARTAEREKKVSLFTRWAPMRRMRSTKAYPLDSFRRNIFLKNIDFQEEMCFFLKDSR
jgi:hypothetical protein